MSSSDEETNSDRCASKAYSVDVLGIEVPTSLLTSWRGWWSPMLQPFPVDDVRKDGTQWRPGRTIAPTPEVRDTFFLYGGDWEWWDEEEFLALPPAVRRRLHTAHRRAMSPKPSPPWPSNTSPYDESALLRWVEIGAVHSRHEEVPVDVWRQAETVLPRARALAGTFSAGGSGANCFATVMAACDTSADEERWVLTEDFTRWLETETSPVQGTALDDVPGTVLFWREHGEPAHAAVTLGGGWVLVKPSQAWSSPRLVQRVRELILSWRYPGTRLERHRLHDRLGKVLWRRETEDIALELPARPLESLRDDGL